jgi:small subunit ribosomal protein S16
MGAKKRPFYRLVVANSTDARDGRFIESIGYYDPCSEPPALKVNTEKAAHWLKCGAQPSDTARALLKKQGLLGGTVTAPAVATVQPAAAAAPDAPVAVAEPTAVAPAEEPVAEAAPVKKPRAPRKTAETPQAAE